MAESSLLAKRVAARWLKALEEVPAEIAMAPPADPAETAAGLPKSGPGRQMFDKYIDELGKAFDMEDADAFGQALQSLQDNFSKVSG